jgi:hypothetical protein
MTILRQILAVTRPSHSHTTSRIAQDWDWTAFEDEKKWTGKNGTTLK